MSIQATINSPDLIAQIAVLKHFPQITARHYIPALKRSTAAVEAVVRPMIPRRTGKAAETFGSKVTGRAIQNLSGRVGWFDKDDPWYINVVEHGARQHPMAGGSVRSKSKFNRFQSALERGESFGGVHVFIGGGWRTMSIHPGFAMRGFLAAGYAATQPIIEREMGAAGDAVVNELANIKSFGIGD